jgi:hypothetical protein
MTAKKVTLGKAPELPAQEQKAAIDKFIKAPPREVNPSYEEPQEQPKQAQQEVIDLPFVEAKQRFPIELPLSMHTFFMVYCKQRRKSLREELAPLIEEHARKLGYKPPQ